MLIIWDFNGTLLDDAHLCFDILNAMLIKRHKHPVSFETYLDIFGFPIEDYYKKAGFDFADETFQEASQEFILRYQKASLELHIFADVFPKMAEFKAKGYTQVLLSASEENNLQEQVNHFQLSPYFDSIHGTSNIYAKGKKDHAVDLLKRYKVDPSDVYFIGDTLHDLEIANALGANALLIARGHQSYKRLVSAHDQVYASLSEVTL